MLKRVKIPPHLLTLKDVLQERERKEVCERETGRKGGRERIIDILCNLVNEIFCAYNGDYINAIVCKNTVMIIIAVSSFCLQCNCCCSARPEQEEIKGSS